jgi:hypothetical protein
LEEKSKKLLVETIFWIPLCVLLSVSSIGEELVLTFLYCKLHLRQNCGHSGDVEGGDEQRAAKEAGKPP